MGILLTQQELMRQLCYDPDTGLFTNAITRNPRAQKGAAAGHVNNLGYVVLQVNRRKAYAHRLAWLYMTGQWPRHEIDHINRVRSDNRFVNLREATPEQNKHNTTSRQNNTTGAKGVVWHKGRKKWQAQISVAGKHTYLGLFDSFDAAVAARKTAVAKFHQFAQEL